MVDRDPGLHGRAIARQVEANDRTAEYHLDRLVKEGVLTTLERGGYTHYFVLGKHTPREMQVLATLKRGRRRRSSMRYAPGRA